MKSKVLSKKVLKDLKFMVETTKANIYENGRGEVIKVFKPELLDLYRILDMDLEKQVLDSEKYDISEEIILPNTIYYKNDGSFCGYKVNKARGIDYNKFEKRLSLQDRANLSQYNLLHKKLENIVKKNKDIVFPDLSTVDNIYIDSNLNFQLIDYDGLQVGDNRVLEISTNMHQERTNYDVPKYFDGKLYNKNLDIKSLIVLYFLETFNADITKVGMINPITKNPITVAEIFEIYNITDYELYDKVSRLFDDTVDNLYLDDTIDRLEKDYKLLVDPVSYNGLYIKRLIKK